MLCTKYNLQSERTFETLFRGGREKEGWGGQGYFMLARRGLDFL